MGAAERTTGESGATPAQTPTKRQAKADRKRRQHQEREAAKKQARTKAKERADRRREGRRDLRRQLRGLVRASHPLQALAVAAALGVGAALTRRPPLEYLTAAAAVLVVALILGLGNDVADAERDRATDEPRKPIADGLLPAGNATFVIGCLVLLAVPLSLQQGWAAGTALLLALPVGWLYNKALRRTWLSFMPWAATAALLVAFLAYGGWGWGIFGAPPTWEITGAAAALAVGLHVLTSLSDLVADQKTGVRHLPLRIALKTGAPRLLVAAVVYTLAAAAALVYVALTAGLRQ